MCSVSVRMNVFYYVGRLTIIAFAILKLVAGIAQAFVGPAHGIDKDSDSDNIYIHIHIQIYTDIYIYIYISTRPTELMQVDELPQMVRTVS